MKTMALVVALVTVLTSLNVFASSGREGGGVANPASEYCISVNGRLTLFNHLTGGQDDICSLGRASLSEWTLFRESAGEKLAAVAIFMTHPQPTVKFHGANPAADYCGQVHGTSEIVTNTTGGAQFGLCNFADGSSIEEWTLLRGPKDPDNAALVSLLKTF